MATQTQNIPKSLKLSIEVENSFHELLIAVLAEIGYYAFEEEAGTLNAYIYEEDYNESDLDQTLSQYLPNHYPERTLSEMPIKDWNAEWEKNFQGITVDNYCEIIPPFKEPSGDMQHLIRIHPKMAFGTGHHATTQLMIRQLQPLDLEGKKVLDMGTGTGILGILAAQKGAAGITGIDIDEWSYQNALENVDLNQVKNMKILRGDASVIPGESYDVIIANINRNVLVEDAKAYTDHLAPNGRLIISGFFTIDVPDLISRYAEFGLNPVRQLEDQNWSSLCLFRET